MTTASRACPRKAESADRDQEDQDEDVLELREQKAPGGDAAGRRRARSVRARPGGARRRRCSGRSRSCRAGRERPRRRACAAGPDRSCRRSSAERGTVTAGLGSPAGRGRAVPRPDVHRTAARGEKPGSSTGTSEPECRGRTIRKAGRRGPPASRSSARARSGEVVARDPSYRSRRPSWPRQHHRDEAPQQLGKGVLVEPDQRPPARGEDEAVDECPEARQFTARLRVRLLDERQHRLQTRRRASGRQDPAVLAIAVLADHAQEHERRARTADSPGCREQRSAQDGLRADVVVGGQNQHPGVSIPVEHDVEDGQQDSRRRASVAGLDDDVLVRDVGERVVPETPVMLGDNHQDPRPGDDRGDAAHGPAQERLVASKRAVLFRDELARRASRERRHPGAFTSGEHHGPDLAGVRRPAIRLVLRLERPELRGYPLVPAPRSSESACSRRWPVTLKVGAGEGSRQFILSA